MASPVHFYSVTAFLEGCFFCIDFHFQRRPRAGWPEDGKNRHPKSIPREAKEKFRMLSPPNNHKRRAANTTVNTVLMERTSVCMMLLFTIAAKSSHLAGFSCFMFSRIRSNITIVSLIEYPTMVSTAAMKTKSTSI